MRSIPENVESGFLMVVAEALKAHFTYRMYDISEFFKALKQRFSQAYNVRECRNGPLWEQRYRGHFGPNRRTGAKPMRFGEWDGLCTLRDLRLAPVSTA